MGHIDIGHDYTGHSYMGHSYMLVDAVDGPTAKLPNIYDFRNRGSVPCKPPRSLGLFSDHHSIACLAHGACLQCRSILKGCAKTCPIVQRGLGPKDVQCGRPAHLQRLGDLVVHRISRRILVGLARVLDEHVAMTIYA